MSKGRKNSITKLRIAKVGAIRTGRERTPRWLIATIVAGMLTLGGCRRPSAEAPAPPPVVKVARPVTREVRDYLDFTGNTAPFNSVKLVARVEGYLQKIHFTDGAEVKKGQLLFTIQQSQYRAQLEQARAQVLAQKAALAHARIEYARYSRLEKKHAATQTAVDHWRYQMQSAEAGLLGAQAQVKLAKLNLDYTEIRAPFNGWIGRHLVDPGNLVGTMGKQTVLANIEQIDPLYVYFTINERDLLRIIRMRKSEGLPIERPVVPVYFGLSDENGYPHRGHLDFASISVAPTTGTLQVRAIFPNHDKSVFPGLFVRVRILSPRAHKELLIQGDAVSFDQQGPYVLVVGKDNIVRRVGVKTGFQVGTMMVITQGLSTSDRVVVQGLLQAIPGRKVEPEAVSASVTPTTARAGD